MRKQIKWLWLLVLAACPAIYGWAADTAAGTFPRPAIEKKDDLPRHVYRLEIPVTDLYLPQHRQALLELAAQVRADIEGDIAAYEIRDANTLQDFYELLGSIAILEGRWQEYLDLLDRRRALETKQANRLTMGIYGEALARAQLTGAADRSAEVRRLLQTKLRELPYELVQDNIKSTKGATEILTPAFVLGNLDSSFQPIVEKTGGEISYDIAAALVGASYTLDYFIPDAGMVNAVLTEYIDDNDVPKEDIWAARKVELSADSKASPVVIAVWDSGVDTAIFEPAGQLWINRNEIPGNGVDDDGNGYIDDVHGVAYDLHSNKEVSLVYPIGDLGGDEQRLQEQMKGLGDITSNIDSPEAARMRKTISQLPQEQVKDFLESINLYGNYSHGTHVAGIALESNPFARLLVARLTYGHTQIPEKPTVELAHAEARMYREVAAYYRANGVRAVNMSWGGSLRGVEDALEAHDVGGTPEQRKALAREIFNIGDAALREAISGSPDILFITSAGNSDNDVRFDEFYPSSYDYPNLLTVGAVDAAGEETSFTSLGKVDIYANGFEVESYVPGGDRIPFSGTSMSSPQVLNLASKLLAIEPQLSVAQLRELILEGADEKQLAARTIRLMNPKASVAVLRQRMASPQ